MPDILLSYVAWTRIQSSGNDMDLNVRVDICKIWQQGPAFNLDTGRGIVTYYAYLLIWRSPSYEHLMNCSYKQTGTVKIETMRKNSEN